MNNTELAKKLAAKSRLSEEQANAFVVGFADVMTDYFKRGEKVVIAEFGSFFVGENKKVQFNPSAKLKDQIS